MSAIEIIAPISAAEWNRRVVDFLRDNQILGSTVFDGPEWRHPWTVTPAFDSSLAQWRATIEPGFVNGLDATVQIATKLAPAETLARIERETRKRIDNPEASSAPVESWLTEEPSFPLTSWRAIGPDSSPAEASSSADGSPVVSFEAVPAFFRFLGVGPSPDITFADEGFKESQGGVIGDPAAGRRLLRGLDLVLYQDRAGLATQWSFGVPSDPTIAQFAVQSVINPSARRRSYIRQTGKWSPPFAPSSADFLAGDFTDGTRDEWKLATVYLVSPPDAPLDAEIDGTWTPFVQHFLFWNRNYATQNPAPVTEQNIELRTGLAAGVGDVLNQFILGQINDAQSAANVFLNSQRTGGKAWTI